MPRRRKTNPQQSMLFSRYVPQEIENQLSVTPFRTGENQELVGFIAEHAVPYDPNNDLYEVPAFTKDLVVNKATPPKAIYDMHAYWSKKHWAAIREYISHYLPPEFYPYGSGIILDGMCGSGMTGVAALMENKTAVLVDASPAAAFIAHHYTHPVNASALRTAFERLLVSEYGLEVQQRLAEATGRRVKNLQEELCWLYETKCDRCGGNAALEYVVYSQQFQCPNCGKLVALFDCPEVPVEYVSYTDEPDKSEKRRGKRKSVCPHCYEEHGRKGYPEFVISTRTEKHGYIPVKISYICEAGCKPKRGHRQHDDENEKKIRYFTQDANKIGRIERIVSRFDVPHQYPQRRMMDTPPEQEIWGVKWRRGTSSFQTIAELYTPRNLWGLAALNSARPTSSRDSAIISFLGLLVTGTAHLLSKMNRNRDGGGGTSAGTYYVPPIFRETLVSSVAERKLKDLETAASELPVQSRRCLVSNQSSTDLSSIPDCTIDYIFTDPPYVDKVQYGELNFIWDAWLDFSSNWLRDEIIVNSVRGKTLEDWETRMRQALAEYYRVLKPGRWISLCYHDSDPGTWRLVQDMLLDIGFEIHTVTELDPLQKSSNQITSEKVVKSDLVLNCRRPRPGEEGANESELPELVRITDRVRDILLDALASDPGQTSDRLWSLTLKRLLTRGQMVEHRFTDILGEIADQVEGGRWYLKESYDVAASHDQGNEESAGAVLKRFAQLRMVGVPANWAATIVLEKPGLAQPGVDDKLDESAIEAYVQSRLNGSSKPFRLGGNLRGTEFYDVLWFYMTRYMRDKRAAELPRRNLADFLGDYLVRFRASDKWLYRPPDAKEEEDLAAGRRSGLGRRIRAFVSAIQQRDHSYLEQHRPDARTLVVWLRHCAQFGLYEEGRVLFEGSGVTVQQMERILYNPEEEETAYDVARGYADICRRNLPRQRITVAIEEEDESDESEDE